jgi:hypothetical protein
MTMIASSSHMLRLFEDYGALFAQASNLDVAAPGASALSEPGETSYVG